MSAGLTLDLRNYRDWLKQVQTLDQTLDSLDRTVDRIAASMNRAESGFGDITSKTRTASTEIKQATSALDSLDKELRDTSSGASSAASNMNKVAGAADDMGDEVSQASSSAGGGFGGFVSKVTGGAPMIAAAFAAIVASAAAMAIGIGVEASNAYIEWESAFAGVVKTVDGTEEQLADLEDQIRGMATDSTNPVAGLENSAVILAGIAEQGGQLGVPIENLKQFTEVMAMLQMAAPALGDEAPQSLAQFANIVKMPLTDIDRLASTIVNLGNNMATTEPAIVEFMHRLAGAGDMAGFTEAEIAGLAAAMASVGLNPEAGGSAMTQTLNEMANAVGSLEVKTVTAASQKAGAESRLNTLYEEQAAAMRELAEAQDMMSRNTDKTSLKTANSRSDDLIAAQVAVEEINAEIARLQGNIDSGAGFVDKTIMEAGESLHIFSEIAGLTAQEFAETWKANPEQALLAFAEGLSKLDQAKQNAILEDLELDGLQVADTLRRLAGNTELVTEAFAVANEGWEENNALQKEAAARFDTTEAQINLAKNQFKELGYTIGEALNPYLREALELFNGLLGVAGTELTGFFESIGLIQAKPETTAELTDQNTLLEDRAEILAQIAAREAELGTGGGALDTYIVQAGDSLGRLAAQWGTTIAAIQEANPQLEGKGIQPGDEVKNPVAVEVTGDEQLDDLNNKLTATEHQIKQARDEMREFGNESQAATQKVSPFQEKIASLQESFMKLASPIKNAVSEAIGELITSLQAIPPEDIENMKTLAEAVGLFIAVFVGIPVAIAGVTALASALFALNFAANAIEPTVDILSGLGEVLQGIKEGDPEKIANGIKQIVEGWVGLNVAAVEALGEMGITIVQFFADLAGIDVDVAARVEAALHSFDLLAPILENIQARVELGFANFKLSILNGINDILEAFNSLVSSAPDFVLDAAGIEAGSDVVETLDTSGAEAAVARQQVDFDLLVGADQATMLENAKTEGGGYSQAYLDGVIEKLNDPTLTESVRSTLIGVLKSAFDGEGVSVENELNAEQLFGEGLSTTLKGLGIKLSTEEDGALDFSEVEQQIQSQLDAGLLEGEEVVIAINAKLQLNTLQGEDAALTEGDAALLGGFDLTSILPDGAPLLTAGEDYGLNLQTGMQQGIEANSQLATDAATTAGNSVITAYGNALGVQSPSTLTTAHGTMLDEGLALGILANQGVIGAAIATVLMQFSQIEARTAQTAASTRGNFAAMGAGMQGLAGTVAGASMSIVGHLNSVQSAAANALAVLNQLATQAGVPISVAGASVVGGIEQRAEGGFVNAGQVYNVAERSTGGVELFQAPDGLYMISAQSGTIIPPQTMPQQTFYNQSSGGLVFSPQITIGANAGVTEGQVRGILWDSLSEMQRMMEPSEMAFERAGF